MTTEQIWLIMDAHGIAETLDNEEEREILCGQNPELLDAYQELMRLAQEGGEVTK